MAAGSAGTGRGSRISGTRPGATAIRQTDAVITVLPPLEPLNKRARDSSMRAPGRTISVATSSSATGTGPKKSYVMRATRASSRGNARSMARTSSAAGGLPCESVGPQGPTVALVGWKRVSERAS